MAPSDLDLTHNERAQKWGHRKFTGGDSSDTWYGIGKRQYHFLISQGLTPEQTFLDVACGGLRLGQYLIPALNPGNYYGLEAEEGLVQAALREEILFDIAKVKQPKFAYNYDFDLAFCPGYDFAIAQSLFTHMVLDDIQKCFAALRPVARPASKFFFTFHEGDKSQNTFDVSHENRNWFYDFGDIQPLAEACDFDCTYIGDWGHERNQKMGLAIPRS